MKIRLTAVRYLRGHVLHLSFSDGAEGELDLANELDGEMFEPLRDIELFRQARLDPELHTVVWPNGADLSPEFLRASVRVEA